MDGAHDGLLFLRGTESGDHDVVQCFRVFFHRDGKNFLALDGYFFLLVPDVSEHEHVVGVGHVNGKLTVHVRNGPSSWIALYDDAGTDDVYCTE